MNCIGPTARSCVLSPSYAPLSVSEMLAKPTPSRTGPRIGESVVPLASTRPPRAWPDSTLPIAASSCHGTWQPGSVPAMACWACLYAARTVAGMPASTVPVAGRSMEVPGLSGVFSGGRSV